MGGGNLTGTFGSVLVRLLDRSWRYREVRKDGRVRPPGYRAGGAIYALWHQQLLMLTARHRDEGIAILISRSRDGRQAASVVRRLGYHVVLGSTSRGGLGGLRSMVRAAREGHPLAVTIDGPRGPARRCKPGPILMARLSGVPIVPVVAVPTRAHVFGSWDRFLLPAPGSRVYLGYGEEIRVPEGEDGGDVQRWMEVLARGMDETEARCERAAGRSWRSP